MRVPIRTSKWAVWSSRSARLALPVIVIAVLMHRGRLIDSQTFLVAAGAGALLGVVALLIGIGAYLRIWFTGDRGWRPATIGVVTGLICLAPAGYAGVMASRYPPVHDVSTDIADPPPIVGDVAFGLGVGFHDAALQDRVAAAFPNVKARDYPLNAAQCWNIVSDLVAELGWQVIYQRRPSSGDPGTLNAVAMTGLGWRDEVAIRVTPGTGGSRIDMRSVSYAGMNDLGANGIRIEAFLLALDDRVTEHTHELGLLAPN